MPRIIAWVAIVAIILALIAAWTWVGRNSAHPPGQQAPPHAINQSG